MTSIDLIDGSEDIAAGANNFSGDAVAWKHGIMQDVFLKIDGLRENGMALL